MDSRHPEELVADWRALFTPEQYIEHLESLVRLQLETIALRDEHNAELRETAERAAEHAKSLEADRERRERYIRGLELQSSRFRRTLARALQRFRL